MTYREPLLLPEPQQTDCGLIWRFSYRDQPCEVLANHSTLHLRMAGREVDPVRVLNAAELQEDWQYLLQPHVLRHAILERRVIGIRLLVLNVERILHRYADVLDGGAPPSHASH